MYPTGGSAIGTRGDGWSAKTGYPLFHSTSHRGVVERWNRTAMSGGVEVEQKWRDRALILPALERFDGSDTAMGPLTPYSPVPSRW